MDKFNKYINTIQLYFSKVTNRMQKNYIGDFFYILTRNIIKYDIRNSSASIAFFFTLSFFPFLLLLMTIIPMINFDHTPIVNFVSTYVPSYLKPILLDFQKYMSSTHIPVLSFSFIVSFYSSSTATSLIVKHLSRIFDSEFSKSGIIQRILSLIINFFFIAFLFVFTISITILHGLFNLINELLPVKIMYLSRVFEILGISLFCFVIFLILYNFSTPRRMPIKDTYIGAICVTIILIVSFYIFNFYLLNFSKYISYGIMGSIIIAMLYLYILSISILLGAVINKSIIELKSKKI